MMGLHHLAELQCHGLVVERVVFFESRGGDVYGDFVIFARADDGMLAHLLIKDLRVISDGGKD